MRFLFLLLAIAVFVVAGCAKSPGASDSSGVVNLGPAEFAKLVADKDVFLIDVHVPEQGHINGTDAFIPYDVIAGNSDKLPADFETPVAVYCRSGSMSAEAAKTLSAMGYKKVFNLVGGKNAFDAMDAIGASPPSGRKVTLMKSASCGCCSEYGAYLERKGFEVERVNLNDMVQVKRKHGIPDNMQSCHTLIVDDYFVEGHVPIEAVSKLLAEHPDVDGIALPGMPMGAPGMTGARSGNFIVYGIKNGIPSEFVRI
ncbi:hypothetical protein HYU12_01320 [Candidatus Woesearchaeota archaeon]|nr:hypothetical protein [Candidatus Woesearchaeota archaeon]